MTRMNPEMTLRVHVHSQKVRLQRCGLSRAIYLVEGNLERWPHAGERSRMAQEVRSL